MVVVDADGYIVDVNRHALTLFGYTREELVGQRIELLVPTELRARHIKERSRFAADPHTRPMGVGLDLHGLKKDGSQVPVEISLSPLKPEGELLVLASIRDVTDRKRVERALQDKNLELERASHVKDSFLAGMSHELRTPLNAIVGFTGTLLMKLPGPLTPEQEEQLRTIQSSARHLLSIINDLLDVARIESGKVELRPEPIVSQSVIKEVGSALSPLAKAKGLKLQLKLPREDVTVLADRRALSQILINLVNNAIKFTEQGSVTVTVGRSGGDAVAITVTDTGPGIRNEDKARLFQMFQKLETSATSPHEGTGLGLYLSLRLSQLLGGRISFDSEFGKGSRFTLTLPAAGR